MNIEPDFTACAGIADSHVSQQDRCSPCTMEGQKANSEQIISRLKLISSLGLSISQSTLIHSICRP